MKKIKEENKKLIEENKKLIEENKYLDNFSKALESKISSLENIWKKYNLSRYYDLNDKEIGKMRVITNSLTDKEINFINYNFDAEFLNIFTKDGLIHYAKNIIERIEIIFENRGDKND